MVEKLEPDIRSTPLESTGTSLCAFSPDSSKYPEANQRASLDVVNPEQSPKSPLSSTGFQQNYSSEINLDRTHGTISPEEAVQGRDGLDIGSRKCEQATAMERGVIPAEIPGYSQDMPSAWNMRVPSAGSDAEAEGSSASSPRASRSSRTHQSPLQVSDSVSAGDGSPGRRQWKLSWLRWPAGTSSEAGGGDDGDGIVRRASESAMGILSAYADAHTVCRRVSSVPWIVDTSETCRLDPCHETDAEETE